MRDSIYAFTSYSGGSRAARPPPLIFRPNWGPKAWKKIFLSPSLPPSPWRSGSGTKLYIIQCTPFPSFWGILFTSYHFLYLFLSDAKLLWTGSTNLQVIHIQSVPPFDRCQTPHEGFHLQVIHKYSVPPSEGYQTHFEGFHLQLNNKHLLMRDANLLLRDSMLAILRCFLPYALIIERFLIFQNPTWRPLLVTSQTSSGATTHKIYLVLLRRSKVSTKGKIVSKYCNISKPPGKGSIHPPSPCTTVGVWICVYVRVLTSCPNWITPQPA